MLRTAAPLRGRHALAGDAFALPALPTMIRFALLVLTSSALQPAPPKRLFISGLGYVGLRTAVQFHESWPDCAIAGCVRSEEKAAALRARYPWLEASVFDLNENYSGLDAAGVRALASSSHALFRAAASTRVEAHAHAALPGTTGRDLISCFK